MAFLRFSRDKRGYENFYLVETSTNRRGKTRARVLYWFRTPPGVKVGREPFDPEVRRALELQNPNIVFDWRKISETPIPSPDADRWRERRRLERAERSRRRDAPADLDTDEDGESAESDAPEDSMAPAAELPDHPEAADQPENVAMNGTASAGAEPDELHWSDAGETAPFSQDETEAVLSGTATEREPPSDPSTQPPPTEAPRRRRRRRRRGGRRSQETAAGPVQIPSGEIAAAGSNDSSNPDDAGESSGPDESDEV